MQSAASRTLARGGACVRSRDHVLVLGFGASRAALAKRLRLLGFAPAVAESPEEVAHERERCGDALRAALVPLRPAEAAHALSAADAASPVLRGLHVVAVGPPPEPEERSALREAGVTLALPEPFEDGELRFVANEATSRDASADRRRTGRVPSPILARVVSASGAKAAFVYSLSTEGVFLETHRPTSPRGRIDVELPLPERRVRASSTVVQTNVPGNLQRGNLPMGMGVRFEAMEPEDRAALERYVQERRAQIRV